MSEQTPEVEEVQEEIEEVQEEIEEAKEEAKEEGVDRKAIEERIDRLEGKLDSLLGEVQKALKAKVVPAPVKKPAPKVVSEEKPAKKKSPVSRTWFGSRADD